MEKERHATAIAPSYGVVVAVVPVAPVRAGEFKRGSGTVSRRSSAGSYLDPPLVSFVLISGLSYNTTFNKELWISSFPL
jgi:hypothetical protein